MTPDEITQRLRDELELERWQHAGCLTFAEGHSLDDDVANMSVAMRAVRDLRKQYESLQADRISCDEAIEEKTEINAGMNKVIVGLERDIRDLQAENALLTRALELAVEDRNINDAAAASEWGTPGLPNIPADYIAEARDGL
jgi:hypothetical protein